MVKEQSGCVAQDISRNITNMADFSGTVIREIEEWINRYPRKILEFKTAEEMFNLQMAA